LEPSLQVLIEKNKEEVRRAIEECEKRVEAVRVRAEIEKAQMQDALEKDYAQK
jgi:hypothetical protein